MEWVRMGTVRSVMPFGLESEPEEGAFLAARMGLAEHKRQSKANKGRNMVIGLWCSP